MRKRARDTHKINANNPVYAEKARSKTKKRYHENPVAHKAHVRNRKLRLRKAEGRHTGAELISLFEKQNGKCTNCIGSIKRGYHVDHIVPVSRGGSNWITNIQLLCSYCNLRKHARDPLEFARAEGRLL
jgi:5-methylcytosine-specific restriction endonuclease McrA